MNILIFFPAFLIFIFTLYKLVKDDYVLIRKNISPEQIFDITFVTVWISLFFSRILFLVMHPQTNGNIFLSFFSLQANDFSISGLLLGGISSLYLISRHKRYPINNLLDVSISAFAVSLPIGILSTIFFVKEYELLLCFINGIVYAIFAYYLVRYTKAKLAMFLLFFSFISLINSFLLQFIKKISFITIENVFFVILIIICTVLLLKRK